MSITRKLGPLTAAAILLSTMAGCAAQEPSSSEGASESNIESAEKNGAATDKKESEKDAPLAGSDGFSFAPIEVVILRDVAPANDKSETSEPSDAPAAGSPSPSPSPSPSTGSATTYTTYPDGQARVRVLASDKPGLCARIQSFLAMNDGEHVVSAWVEGEAASMRVGRHVIDGEKAGASLLDGKRICAATNGEIPFTRGKGSFEIKKASESSAEVEGVMDVDFPGIGRVRGAFKATACAGKTYGQATCGGST